MESPHAQFDQHPTHSLHSILAHARMKHFTPEQKHEILLDYQPYSHTHSFAALAARHAVAGGAEVVRRWHEQWNHTAASLQEKQHTGRPRILTSEEVQSAVATPIRRKNRAHQSVHYTQLQPEVEERTGKRISVRTIQRYGKVELKGKLKHGKKRTAEECKCIHNTREHWDCQLLKLGSSTHTCSCSMLSVSSDMCEQIATVRRKFQRIGSLRILVLDETHKRIGDVTTRTIVLPGESSTIETSATTHYAPRYDMIACCTSKEVLPPMIYAPKERGRGVDTEMRPGMI